MFVFNYSVKYDRFFVAVNRQGIDAMESFLSGLGIVWEGEYYAYHAKLWISDMGNPQNYEILGYKFGFPVGESPTPRLKMFLNEVIGLDDDRVRPFRFKATRIYTEGYDLTLTFNDSAVFGDWRFHDAFFHLGEWLEYIPSGAVVTYKSILNEQIEAALVKEGFKLVSGSYRYSH